MKTRVNSLLSGAVIFLGLLTACLGKEGTKPNDILQMNCQPEQFVQLDLTTRDAVIATCSPEQQVELYLAWSKSTLPNNFDYERTIAKTGEPLIPALLSVLERPNDISNDMDKIEVLLVMEQMDHRGYYEISKNSVLMSRIENAIIKISDEFTKDWAFEIYSKIEYGRKR